MASSYMIWKHKWMTVDKEVLRIVDMDDRHLRNTIRMLVRWADLELANALKCAFSCEMMLQGDEALTLIDQEIDNLIDARPADYAYENYKPFPKMVEEAAKRGMTI